MYYKCGFGSGNVFSEKAVEMSKGLECERDGAFLFPLVASLVNLALGDDSIGEDLLSSRATQICAGVSWQALGAGGTIRKP